ncbi:MAG: STAS domain-containing protein [Planctomycetota bacterium]
MKIQSQQHGAVTVLKPEGPLGQEDAEQFKDSLLHAMRENLGRIVLDASGIPFVDSQGLETLVDITNEMSRSGQLLKLCALNKTIRQVLEFTGLSPQFEHFEDANSAVRSFL